MHTVKWYKESDLSILHPLSDAVPCALLNTSNERRVVDNAIKDFPAL